MKCKFCKKQCVEYENNVDDMVDKIISTIKLWRPVFFSKIKTEEDFKELYEELYKLLKNL